MSKKGKIKLDIGTRSFYMDGVKRSGGYIQEETKAVNGICEISQARRRRYFSSAAGSLRQTRLTLGLF